MSFINNIRRAIALAITPNDTGYINNQQEPVKSLTYSGRKQVSNERVETPVILAGELTLSQIQHLHSQKVVASICNYGAWESLARAFSAYSNLHKTTRQVNPKLSETVGHQLDRFHAFNAAMDSAGQGAITEEGIYEIVVKLAIVKPVKENEQTDAILARVKKLSIEEVRAERKARQDKEEARRVALIDGFCAEVWSVCMTDSDVTISAQHAYSKAVSCLEWMANWDNPDMGEILLAEADVKTLERMADRAGRIQDGAGEGSREIDEALLDAAGMRQGGHK